MDSHSVFLKKHKRTLEFNAYQEATEISPGLLVFSSAAFCREFFQTSENECTVGEPESINEREFPTLRSSVSDTGVVALVKLCSSRSGRICLDFDMQKIVNENRGPLSVFVEAGARVSLCCCGLNLSLISKVNCFVGVGAKLIFSNRCFSESVVSSGIEYQFHLQESAILDSKLWIGGYSSVCVVMDGEYAKAKVLIPYVVGSSERIELSTRQLHRAQKSESEISVRGCSGSHSLVFCHGEIVVEESAIGSKAKQEHKNLVVGGGCEISSTPSLDVRTDDAECSHGCAISDLQAAELFYARSRGIGNSVAQKFIVEGFLCSNDIDVCLNSEFRFGELVSKVIGD